ncbi:biotin/lipoyl-containing protein [Antarctobacter heliothermus]|uniref:Pyruvate dehydrogenase E2 component (Dihydrolipoamide acetyltransferase) n=1 Tax=Antarctobacter heliothermus TaxID=74033 RepID=A0A239EW09_9RHOB|nr:biotin/lipoyl-containing protein [Antarctobacter heliothermus]SNS48815.1 pyruvate dehydrogenase E2 component (dihydrolipoamide acetyltransferase) [Antarctobacter heliothermus]
MPREETPGSASHEVIMPALGMAQDTGLIVAWHKAPGDAVAEGDVLFEVETDKATMEVEAPAAGFLTDVRAQAGEDVPVGNVIALISATAEDSGSAAPPAPSSADDDDGGDKLPDGNEVIMPALGMAQDTGLIVAWHKTPGDAVSASDILFEVETDKSTMEVEAGQDGYVAALLALAGEEAPVGGVIALISADKPDTPIQRSIAAGTAPKATPPTGSRTPSAPKPPSEPAPKQPQTAAAPSAQGRILASPKARRLALQEGLDLNRLVGAGHAQPFHVRDLDTLRAMPEAAPTAASAGTAARHLTAQAADGFSGFAHWASETAGLSDVSALLAGLAAASLGREAVVDVERFGQGRTYATHAQLGQTARTDAPPALRLRDMRDAVLSSVHIGPEEVPVLTLTQDDAGIAITLECSADQLSPGDALRLISNFAGRIEHPLRHLL